MDTSTLSLWISKNALAFALTAIFIILSSKFLEWWDYNKQKIYKFRDKIMKGGKKKNGMDNQKEN